MGTFNIDFVRAMEGRVMRVGIVGVGTIGQALAKAIDRGEVAVQLTALHSRNLAKAQAFARTLGRVP
jgi:predicted dehydrogenase